jgi:hypothetical protein
MTSENENLCIAIITFLGFGESISPNHDFEKITEIFGRELLDKVLLVLEEAGNIEVNWSNNLTLADAGAFVRCEMQRRHPDLTDSALDAIAWKYTYDWR